MFATISPTARACTLPPIHFCSGNNVFSELIARAALAIWLLCSTPKTDCLKIRDHLITSIDNVMRKHPECGVIIAGDFNQLRDNFMKTHYIFVQAVNVVTRGQAILDKI